MKRSEHRILTTHVGSLPRPPALRDLLVQQDHGEAIDAAALTREAEAAVMNDSANPGRSAPTARSIRSHSATASLRSVYATSATACGALEMRAEPARCRASRAV